MRVILISLMCLMAGMAIADTSRSVQVRSLMDSHKTEIQDIYFRYLQQYPELSGSVLVWVAVGSSGKVLSAGISQDNTGGVGIADELLELVKGWDFGTGKNETISFPIELTPPPPGAYYSGRSERSADELNHAFESKRKEMNAFYDRRRAEKPSLAGEIRLKVSVDELGTIKDVTVIKDEPQDEALTQKFVELVKECHLTQGPAGDVEFYINFMHFGKWSGN
jgi:outer membrane biosynthesis protein TonB